MKDEKIQLEEQQAPLKNTDKAFVQVSKDGSPSMPETDSENNPSREDPVAPRERKDVNGR